MDGIGGELCGRLRDWCEKTRPALPAGPFRDAVDAAVERLGDGRLVVAVGGRLNAGKSTLVNALLGQQLAPTGGTETTLLSARFAGGPGNRVWVHFQDGRPPQAVPARIGGGVPAGIPWSHHEVSHLVVESPNTELDGDVVWMDTPGRDAVSALDAYSMRSIRSADALVLVMPQPGEDDAEALKEFRTLMTGSGLSAANVVGVLSRIDQLGDSTDVESVLDTAGRVAASTVERLQGLVAEVVPVATRLAETARCDLLSPRHVLALRELAAAPDALFEELCYDRVDFLEADAGALPVPREVREELLALLDVYGVRQAVAAVRAGARSPRGLREALCARSGMDTLLGSLRARLLAMADPLRADAAAGLLRAAARVPGAVDPETAAQLRTLLRGLSRHPAMRRGELAEAAQAHSAGLLPLSRRRGEELQALLAGATNAERLGLTAPADRERMRERAAELVDRWREVESGLPLRLRRYATVVREVHEAVWFAVDGG